MTAARQDVQHQEPEFVTLDLRNPVEVFRQELTAQAEALAAIEAVRTLAPSLQAVGLQHLTIALGPTGGLRLTGMLPSALEFEFEPTHQISVAFRQAANQAGGWVETVEFQVTHGE